MKKIASIVLIGIMLCMAFSAFAEVNLSGMTYDELIALKDQINLAIWNSQEWQEVTVPQGEWVVGQDIPAGTWTVKCADVNRDSYMLSQCDLEWGYKNGEYIDVIMNCGGYATIYNPQNRTYETGSLTEMKIELKDGMVFHVRKAHAPVVFTPYTGKPDLGFK